MMEPKRITTMKGRDPLVPFLKKTGLLGYHSDVEGVKRRLAQAAYSISGGAGRTSPPYPSVGHGPLWEESQKHKNPTPFRFAVFGCAATQVWSNFSALTRRLGSAQSARNLERFTHQTVVLAAYDIASESCLFLLVKMFRGNFILTGSP